MGNSQKISGYFDKAALIIGSKSFPKGSNSLGHVQQYKFESHIYFISIWSGFRLWKTNNIHCQCTIGSQIVHKTFHIKTGEDLTSETQKQTNFIFKSPKCPVL